MDVFKREMVVWPKRSPLSAYRCLFEARDRDNDLRKTRGAPRGVDKAMLMASHDIKRRYRILMLA